LLKLTEGQAHDGRSAQDMLGTLGRGDVLLGDRAYDSDALRQDLATRGARANVRLMPNRVNLPPFNKRLYRQRNQVERFFNTLKPFPRRRDRYDKRDDNYLLASSSPQSEFGYALMSRWPRASLHGRAHFRWEEGPAIHLFNSRVIARRWMAAREVYPPTALRTVRGAAHGEYLGLRHFNLRRQHRAVTLLRRHRLWRARFQKALRLPAEDPAAALQSNKIHGVC